MLELDLIQQARAGDMDAFCRLYGIYRSRLYRYARYRLGNEADAEDAVSECVLSAWKQIGALRDPKAFPAWIYRILSGCCGAVIRRQIEQRQIGQRQAGAPSPGSGIVPSPGETADTSYGCAASSSASHTAPAPGGTEADETVPSATRLILEEALALLTEEDRNIVLLSVIGGCRSHEIGEMTGLAPGTVRSRLSRSLKKMRTYLEAQD